MRVLVGFLIAVSSACTNLDYPAECAAHPEACCDLDPTTAECRALSSDTGNSADSSSPPDTSMPPDSDMAADSTTDTALADSVGDDRAVDSDGAALDATLEARRRHKRLVGRRRCRRYRV